MFVLCMHCVCVCVCVCVCAQADSLSGASMVALAELLVEGVKKGTVANGR